MKLTAIVGGKPVRIQIVTRKNGTMFIRRAAHTWDNPTPAQGRIRYQFYRAASGAGDPDDHSRERVIGAVRSGVKPVVPRKKYNEIEEILARYYPGQVTEIVG